MRIVNFEQLFRLQPQRIKRRVLCTFLAALIQWTSSPQHQVRADCESCCRDEQTCDDYGSRGRLKCCGYLRSSAGVGMSPFCCVYPITFCHLSSPFTYVCLLNTERNDPGKVPAGTGTGDGSDKSIWSTLIYLNLVWIMFFAVMLFSICLSVGYYCYRKCKQLRIVPPNLEATPHAFPVTSPTRRPSQPSSTLSPSLLIPSGASPPPTIPVAFVTPERGAEALERDTSSIASITNHQGQSSAELAPNEHAEAKSRHATTVEMTDSGAAYEMTPGATTTEGDFRQSAITSEIPAGDTPVAITVTPKHRSRRTSVTPAAVMLKPTHSPTHRSRRRLHVKTSKQEELHQTPYRRPSVVFTEPDPRPVDSAAAASNATTYGLGPGEHHSDATGRLPSSVDASTSPQPYSSCADDLEDEMPQIVFEQSLPRKALKTVLKKATSIHKLITKPMRTIFPTEGLPPPSALFAPASTGLVQPEPPPTEHVVSPSVVTSPASHRPASVGEQKQPAAVTIEDPLKAFEEVPPIDPRKAAEAERLEREAHRLARRLFPPGPPGSARYGWKTDPRKVGYR